MRLLFMIILMIFLATNVFAKGGFSSSGGRGGFSSSRSFSSSRPSYRPSNSPRSYSTSRTTTTITRSYPMGGFGFGHEYSSGLIHGLIIGNLMHPAGTVVYQGGGYPGQALLYPNGTVVDSNGYQVGTYVNGVFTPKNGGLMASPAPTESDNSIFVIIFDIIGGIIILALIFFALKQLF